MENFDIFFQKQQARLLSYLIRLTGDYDLSLDILQESFTRFLEKYEKKTRNVALLYTIARNCFLDYKRKRRRYEILDKDYMDDSRSQADKLEINQEYQQVLSAIMTLPEDEREILALITAGDLSYREIAHLVGITRENVKVKVHRARIKLKKIMSSGES